MNTEEIMAGRECILNAFSKETIKFPDGNYECKGLTDLVRSQNWLITSVKVERDKDYYFFVFFDPTCEQEAHLHDLEEYSIELYNKFSQDSYRV